jgi:SAM-dependent methyltransferase
VPRRTRRAEALVVAAVTVPPSPNELWEQRFAADEYLYGTEPNAFLAASLARLPRGRALCLAEGEGRNAVHLAEAGYEVTSVDLTRAGVAKTRRLAAERGVEVDARVGDLASFDLGDDCWDLVVSSFAHVPPEVRRRVHAQLPVALRPGGAFLLEAYRPAQIGRGTGGPPVLELTMTLAALREELSGLELVHAEELERPVLEGTGHTGVGAVVQVIATRPPTR